MAVAIVTSDSARTAAANILHALHASTLLMTRLNFFIYNQTIWEVMRLVRKALQAMVPNIRTFIHPM